jgi:hypothetical protein
MTGVDSEGMFRRVSSLALLKIWKERIQFAVFKVENFLPLRDLRKKH